MGEAKATAVDPAIAGMPRGGPNASWLDRRLQTGALEYTDRYDVPDEVKQTVIRALDRVGTRTGQHEKNARTALGVVADIPNPRILELGAGHGKLSAKIVELHPTATVTVSDLDPTSVATIATGDLGAHTRVRTQIVDAGAIDADDGSYDLVVFAAAFHHLPPATAVRTIAEATRVGRQFLVIDIERSSPLQLILTHLMIAPLAAIAMTVRPSFRHVIHDGFISSLRVYSQSAFVALGKAVDPHMRVEFLPRAIRFGPGMASLVFSRPGATPMCSNTPQHKDSQQS
ncbi:class I SAM-dependent methyltransferase [Mycobacterium sp. WUMAC-067]|uniref:class I SAM-dependent methyltransferase n=1 Tax=unclassified Mycobacterium TaxID=2642494 RepID=UPI001CD9A9BE|nr:MULTISPECIES: class I SAM-dependent methyltransferase [unclassified Mycobacterium]MCA2244797.1 class I SAM-dependent methyltransferase [Mycobacterium sp. WUMAC-067]MCA2316007.1 class I SAM-dependent methyltransferase [Mycobacterium sp. WUMAC-025]